MTSHAFAHQLVSIAHNDSTPIVFDVSDPGTGKSYVRIMSFAKRRAAGGGCLLIFAPRSLLRSVWVNDFQKFAPHLAVSVADAVNRDEAFAAKADVYITNIDAAIRVAERKPDFFKKFSELVIDESTSVKHHTSRRSKAILKISKYFEYRCCMTGTPNGNTITDIWHQVMILDGGKRLGNSFYAFREAVCTPRQVGLNRNAVKWADRDGAEEAVFGLLSDIVIRHKFEDCTDIPANHIYSIDYDLTPKQMRAYFEMEQTQMLTLKNSAQSVLAINAAAVATKLLQICCICHDTPVLTDRGWIPIQHVLPVDRIWDGEEWVTHEGSMLQGMTEVIKRHGVWMTPEHRVLTKEGWKDGKSSERFDRADVRLPDSYSTGGNDNRNNSTIRDVGMPMRMWESRRTQEPVPAYTSQKAPAQLRVSSWEQDAWNDSLRTVLQMGRNARPLLQPVLQRLQELGRTWHHSMCKMERLVREFLFGHGIYLYAGAVTWTNRQRQRVQPPELSLGDSKGAGQQYPLQRIYQYAERAADYQAGGAGVWHPPGNASCEDTSVRVDDTTRFEPVYDLINCGPRTRFVVMDEQGKPLIVHNSGGVYGNDGTYTVVDTARYEMILDLVEQRKHSLTFFFWKHQRDALVAEATKRGVTHAVIDGSTSDKEREEIVRGYQAGVYQTLFAHPKSAAHGLTLTKGTATIWSSPTYDLEIFKQGSKRQHRIGQTQKTETIVVLAKGTIEEKVYELMEGKNKRMTHLLDLFGTLTPVVPAKKATKKKAMAEV